jgi:hypothetical protein
MRPVDIAKVSRSVGRQSIVYRVLGTSIVSGFGLARRKRRALSKREVEGPCNVVGSPRNSSDDSSA